MSESNIPWTIPFSWQWTIANEITEIVGGGTPSTKDKTNFETGTIPWITPADLSGYHNKKISGGLRNLTTKGLKTSAAKLMPAGTVLFTSRAPIGYVAIAANPIATNQGFKSFVIKDNTTLVPDFLYYYLHRAKEIVQNLASGTTFLEISGRQAGKIPIPIAPLFEQHRIVEAIESYFTRLDAAEAALKRVQKNLKRYRAAVLKAAVEGRLVPTEAELARKENRTYEPASELLNRILKERRRLWEQNGRKGKYQEPAAPDITNLPELPEGWCWATVEQLAGSSAHSLTDGPFGSNLKTAHYTDSGPRVVRLQNIGDGQFIDSAAHISESHYNKLEKHAIFRGDVVIASLGEDLPRACLIPKWLGPAIVKADCLRFSPDTELSKSDYLMYALNSEPIRQYTKKLVHGVGRPRIGLTLLRQLCIPMPPFPEQKRIVDKIDLSLSIEAETDTFMGHNLKRADRLRQSILKWAFEGKLVDQDPNDEPASVLLARIMAEREKVQGVGKAK